MRRNLGRSDHIGKVELLLVAIDAQMITLRHLDIVSARETSADDRPDLKFFSNPRTAVILAIVKIAPGFHGRGPPHSRKNGVIRGLDRDLKSAGRGRRATHQLPFSW